MWRGEISPTNNLSQFGRESLKSSFAAFKGPSSNGTHTAASHTAIITGKVLRCVYEGDFGPFSAPSVEKLDTDLREFRFVESCLPKCRPLPS